MLAAAVNILLIVGQLAYSQVRVQGAPDVLPVTGGQAGAAGAGSLSPSLVSPAAVPTLAAPLTPRIVAPVAAPAAQVAAAQAAAPTAVAVAAVPAVALAAPASVSLPPAAAAPSAAAPLEKVIGKEAGQGRAQAEPQQDGAAPRFDGAHLFDGAAAPARNGLLDAALQPARTLWDGVRGFLRGQDQAPAFPPKPDQKVRVDGKTYTLGPLAASGQGWALHRLAGLGRSEEAVLVFSPEARGSYDAEKAALEALGRTDVPHPQLKAAADGVLVLVERNLDGWETRAELAKGLRKGQVNGLADLAARLIRLGATAGLSPDNALWEHWRGHWALKRGSGFRSGTAWDTLSQLWAWPGGVSDRAAFLAALRGRLGPDSEAWRKLAGETAAQPELRAAMDELARRDAARAPPEALHFGAGRRDAVFSDEVLSPAALVKRLGYSPDSVKERQALHADDPGKLNTQVTLLRPAGHQPAVLKKADQDIIRNELFTRKAARAFFGRYFETPGALAVLRGYDSTMVMEEAPGSKSWTRPRLTREQRAALALLVHTFGLGDMNPGNVLYGDRVWLIDFEQALSAHGPVPNRVPDERILQEMPWVDADEPPPVEDFLPAVRAWRAFFLAPETQRALDKMLGESGFGPLEISRALSVFRVNVSQLEWTIQADVDFADGLRRR